MGPGEQLVAEKTVTAQQQLFRQDTSRVCHAIQNLVTLQQCSGMGGEWTVSMATTVHSSMEHNYFHHVFVREV